MIKLKLSRRKTKMWAHGWARTVFPWLWIRHHNLEHPLIVRLGVQEDLNQCTRELMEVFDRTSYPIVNRH